MRAPFLLACLFSAGAMAQGACDDCRQAAMREAQRCQSAAAKPTDHEACKARFSQAAQVCNAGACKAQAAKGGSGGECVKCQNTVQAEAQRCFSAARGEGDRSSCAAKMKTAGDACLAGICKGLATAEACSECRAATQAQAQRCAAAARSQAERRECTVQMRASSARCANACKAANKS